MNLANVQRSLSTWVKNPEFEGEFKAWLNEAVDDIAADYNLPGLKIKDPVGFVCKDDEWLYTMPKFERAWVTSKSYVAGDMVSSSLSNYRCILGHTSGATSEPGTGASWETYWELTASSVGAYQKNLFEARNSDYELISILRYSEEIRAMDPDHSETGEHITHLNVEEQDLSTFPMADETIFLWYWRRPTPMSSSSDEPEGIPQDFHERVIIPKTMIKVFEKLSKMTFKQAPFGTLQYWKLKYKEGIMGSNLGVPGMVAFFRKSIHPRKWGGRDSLP